MDFLRMCFCNDRDGFTILELLIVVAIVGILVAMTVVFVSGAKKDSGDAGIKANLINVRTKASFYYNGAATSTSSYNNMCNDRSNGVVKMVVSAQKAYGGFAPRTTYNDTDISSYQREACHDSESAFAVIVPIKDSRSGQPRAWCVDSLNASRRVCTDLVANATVCPVECLTP
jgi:prepilin-type N-terminal cleavage/methylation domain-containing protein